MLKRKDNVVEELNLIQMQVQRMANKSFIVKGWNITFLIAFVTYLATNNKLNLIGWGVISMIGATVYDCYFLWMEKLYREKYNWVRKNIDKDDDLFDLNPFNKRMNTKEVKYWRTFLTKPIIGFYILPAIVVLIIAVCNLV